MATIAEIRANYPQYADMTDTALADAMHAKFYSDMPKDDFYKKVGLSNPLVGQIPAGNTATTPDQPLTLREKIAGAIETPFAVGANMISGPITYLAGAGGPEFQRAVAKQIQYQPRTQVAQNALNAIAQGLEASKLPPYTPVIAGGNVLAESMRPATQAVTDVANVGLAKAEPAITAINAARSKAADKLMAVPAAVSGALSGKSSTAFKEAYLAGKSGDTAFIDALRAKVPPEDLLASVKEGITNIQNTNSAKYAAAKTGWAADPTPLDFTPISQKLDEVKASLTQGGKSKIGSAEQRIVTEIEDVVEQWKNDPAARTTLDLDALKQRLDAIYPESPLHTQAQRAVTSVRNAVKDAIVKQAPDYAEAMKSYEQQLGLVRDITKALGAGDKVAKETALNKLMGVLKDTTSGKFKQELVDQLKQQGGVDILPALAGQDLANWIPSSGLGKMVSAGGATSAMYLHNPALAAVLPFASPRAMGETFYGVGRLAGAGSNAVNALINTPVSKMTPAQLNYLGELMRAQTLRSSQNALQPEQQNQNTLAPRIILNHMVD